MTPAHHPHRRTITLILILATITYAAAGFIVEQMAYGAPCRPHAHWELTRGRGCR